MKSSNFKQYLVFAISTALFLVFINPSNVFFISPDVFGPDNLDLFPSFTIKFF